MDTHKLTSICSIKCLLDESSESARSSHYQTSYSLFLISTINVTSFSSILYCSSSEYWPKKCTQSGNIRFIILDVYVERQSPLLICIESLIPKQTFDVIKRGETKFRSKTMCTHIRAKMLCILYYSFQYST